MELTKEAKLSALRNLMKVMGKKIKHEMTESPEMKIAEGEKVPKMVKSGIEIEIEGPKDHDGMYDMNEIMNDVVDGATDADKQSSEEAVDTEDRPLNEDMREALKRFMQDTGHRPTGKTEKRVMFKPKGMDTPKASPKMLDVPVKKAGRPKKMG